MKQSSLMNIGNVGDRERTILCAVSDISGAALSTVPTGGGGLLEVATASPTNGNPLG